MLAVCCYRDIAHEVSGPILTETQEDLVDDISQILDTERFARAVVDPM